MDRQVSIRSYVWTGEVKLAVIIGHKLECLT